MKVKIDYRAKLPYETKADGTKLYYRNTQEYEAAEIKIASTSIYIHTTANDIQCFELEQIFCMTVQD